MDKTLYDILETSKSASGEAIAASYARLSAALKARLDKGDPAAQVLLTAVKEAYEVLSAPARRAAYDASLTAPRMPRVTASVAARDDFDEPSSSKLPLIIGGLVILAVAIWGYRAYHKQQIEVERLRLEKLEAVEKQRIQLEQERLQAAREIEQQRIDLQRKREEEQMVRTRVYDDRRDSVQQQQRFDTQRRQQQMDEQRRQRDEQIARERDRLDAERRARADREALRRICMERYRRPDC